MLKNVNMISHKDCAFRSLVVVFKRSEKSFCSLRFVVNDGGSACTQNKLNSALATSILRHCPTEHKARHPSLDCASL